MSEDSELGAESDLRRRAAYLLAMLAVVAVLLVVVISAVAGGSGHKNAGGTGPGPLDSQANSSTLHASKTPSTSKTSETPHRHSSTTAAGTGAPTASAGAGGDPQCPTDNPCIIAGDIGNGVAAINDYRTAHGRSSVPGSVSPQAQGCAVRNGNNCSGGWAETELADPNGAQAVQKILPFAHLLDSHLKSVEVGWAYDPKAKLYYFAIVRND